MRDELSFVATAIGSMPHMAAEPALDLIFEHTPSCPLWPQLPKRGFRERMEVQFSEGLPCAVIDTVGERVYFDTADESRFTDAINRFYESYLLSEANDDWTPFKISEKCAAGIPAFERRLRRTPTALLKVHATGPITLGVSVADHKGQPILRNEVFRDVLVKGLIAKCRWQIRKFSPYAQQLLCFIDEPVFANFGLQHNLQVSHYEVVAIINEMVEAVHAAGALCGLHCCGKAEWPILVEGGVDVISFDAYGYGETLALYPRQTKRHLEGGGYFAWGIVPTSDEILRNDAASLVARYDAHVDRLGREGIDPELVHERSIITPSCGCGTLTEDIAGKVFLLLGETAARLRERREG